LKFRTVIAALLAGVVSCASDAAAQTTTAYVNGRWYDGSAFVERTAFVRDDVFVEAPEAAPGTTVDLAGGYVTPAFAEAHHHTVLCTPDRIEQFVRAGVLYAAIMAARSSTRECQAQMHGDGSVEIVSALSSFTATGAHPSQIARNFRLPPDRVDGDWVHYVDSEADLDRVWPRIEANRPDFVKVILSYSEDFERLKSDATIQPWYRGLDPRLVPLIVERAHAAGLEVAAHVMSAHDFEVAVEAGVDITAHMPGFAPGAAFTDEVDHPFLSTLTPDSPRYRISAASAERAAEQGVVAITTLSGDAPDGAAAAANVALLREAGVELLIGSDRGQFNSVDEAIYLVERGLMSASEVLRSLTITTPRYFFRGRRIGELGVGAEATFVVLGGDPLEDINELKRVVSVTQRGRVLYPAAAGR